MSAIDKYILRTTAVAFLLVVFSLTGIVWITQALRNIDLMTDKSQNILIFLAVSSLIIPPLVMVIAPIAWLVSLVHTLNRLATESEIVVLNSAGLSPFRFLRPFVIATAVVSLMIATIGFYVAPKALETFRIWQSEIDADVLAGILRPGEFAKLGSLTISIRARLPGGLISGVFIDDRRNPAERVTIIAETGYVQKTKTGSFLTLQNGNLQRAEATKKDPAFVQFKSYAFDLSQFSSPFQNKPLSARERFIDELISPPPNDPVVMQAPAEFKAELHDRILAPIYPFVFALMAFAVLAPPRTTRQKRYFGITVLGLAIMFVRFTGYAIASISLTKPEIIPLQYFLLAFFAAGSSLMIKKAVTVDVPHVILSWGSALKNRFAANSYS